MTLYFYEATYPNGATERRCYETPQTVGQGAVGDLQYMTPTAAPIVPVPPTVLDATTLAAALVAKGTLSQADVTAAIAKSQPAQQVNVVA